MNTILLESAAALLASASSGARALHALLSKSPAGDAGAGSEEEEEGVGAWRWVVWFLDLPSLCVLQGVSRGLQRLCGRQLCDVWVLCAACV